MVVYKIRVVDRSEYDTLQQLDKDTFPTDDCINFTPGVWWGAYAEAGNIVGFCGVTCHDDFVFFKRAGVAVAHRRRGLHRRLIRVRLAWARKRGFKQAITYTFPHNHRSVNNLIAAGFRLYEPGWKWGGVEALYWMRYL